MKYFFGAYTDVHGVPKAKCVPIAHLADAAAGSELYTVGALEGMGELGPNEDECVSIPDLDEVTVLPWDRRYAIAPANLYFHGEPYTHDFRRILQNQMDQAAEAGFVDEHGRRARALRAARHRQGRRAVGGRGPAQRADQGL